MTDERRLYTNIDVKTVVLASAWNRQGQLQHHSSDTLRILCFFLGYEKGELFCFEKLHQLFTPFSKIIWKFIQLRDFYLFWFQFCLVSCGQSSLLPPMRKLYEWELFALPPVDCGGTWECIVWFLRRVGRNLLVFGEVLLKTHTHTHTFWKCRSGQIKPGIYNEHLIEQHKVVYITC